MPRWEYKVIMMGNNWPQNTQLLNDMGTDGWELVSVTSDMTEVTTGIMATETMTSTKARTAYFKRPVREYHV